MKSKYLLSLCLIFVFLFAAFFTQAEAKTKRDVKAPKIIKIVLYYDNECSKGEPLDEQTVMGMSVGSTITITAKGQLKNGKIIPIKPIWSGKPVIRITPKGNKAVIKAIKDTIMDDVLTIKYQGLTRTIIFEIKPEGL